tara:strand:+ start:19585 stop:20325 length:741 start_codon:yes stop_codon:yes gene_type:complete
VDGFLWAGVELAKKESIYKNQGHYDLFIFLTRRCEMKIVTMLLVCLVGSPLFANELVKEGAHNDTYGEKALAADEKSGELSIDVQTLSRKGDRDAHRRPEPRPDRRGLVYCDYYGDSNTTGFSIYRSRDYDDIGNAVFRSEYECRDAARVANRARTGIVCAKYSNNGDVRHSVYRIHDNKDLGRATITNFQDCQDAVRYSRRGYFCSTYVQNGQTYWSPYSIRTGEDVGSTLYGSLDRCLDNLYNQ